MNPPDYFPQIQTDARSLWHKLEADHVLAAPWHQLFKQVQSPRHVISELLQNADDAGASQANIILDDDHLVFAHNGEDFVAEHFASLCRFGYSNKRQLHTIGFRGVGFKSTFSLGSPVELLTPSLAISFARERFTEPIWLTHCSGSEDGWTRVRVPISDSHRRRELEKNLDEWRSSPISLLFFKNIRRLQISGDVLDWSSAGAGPIADSSWMSLTTKPDDTLLVVRSTPEAFPADAIEEIRQERLLFAEQEADLPPCYVELVLGAPGRLFVVLPTGVKTILPFACNAPFVQDPARLKIKDPETSPTNRWLLERLGDLAARAMLEWLQQPELEMKDRAKAYALLPEVDNEDNSLDGICARAVSDAFDRAIEDRPYLLTDDGNLVVERECVLYPSELFRVWKSDVVIKLLDSDKRPAFCRQVELQDTKKLLHRDVLDEVDEGAVIASLQHHSPPKPPRRELLRLWSYLGQTLGTYHYGDVRSRVNIVPVRGKETLHSAAEVVRLSEKRLLQSDADWDFLSEYLLVMNQNWGPYIVEQRRTGSNDSDLWLGEDAEEAHRLLHSLGLLQSSDMGEVIDRVAHRFFSDSEVKLNNAVRLTHIAAKLEAGTGTHFKFVSRSGHTRKGPLFIDPDGLLEELFSGEWCDEHLLHHAYTTGFLSCSAQEWHSWLATGRSGLMGFPPLQKTPRQIHGRSRLAAQLARRGFSGEPEYRYRTDEFRVDDWDFLEADWRRWERLASQAPEVWGKISKRLFEQPRSYWEQSRSARAVHVATTGATKALTQADLLPEWILRLRSVPCLPDTHGIHRRPDELLRRTAETEPLMDVEPFIAAHMDTEANRALLRLLGVRDRATGPERILECLRALAQSAQPPVDEVEKWYSRLDRLMNECSTSDAESIGEAFRTEAILLTECGNWTKAGGVFLNADDEDVPGAELVRSSVRHLSLWRRIGIAERPTIELALEWLAGLPSGQVLSQADTRRVENLIARHPVRVWEECRHWLNLAGEWAPIETLEYAMSMQSLIKWGHLHDWVKQKTAHLKGLSHEVTTAHPFSPLEHLADKLSNQLYQRTDFPVEAKSVDWLRQFGTELRRVRLLNEEETQRVRLLGLRLEKTLWQSAPGLQIIPYINQTPAGMPTNAEVVWLGETLYVEKRPMAKLVRPVAQELGQVLRNPDLVDAVKLCVDRPAKFVSEYFEENFDLAPREILAFEPAGTRAEEQEVSDEAAGGPAEHSDEHPLDQQPSMSREPQPDMDILAAAQLDDDQEDDLHDSKEPSSRRERKVPIMERFAASLGFWAEGEGRFRHRDGSLITKTDDLFPWERRGPGGALVRYYWAKDHCLEHKPLQLDAAIWTQLDRYGEQHGLVLCDQDDHPIEITGKDLGEMSARREIKLYPATYRLIYLPQH